MKVSIVTISYNQGRFLEEAILSVINQDYPDIEYIVVDPGSNDGSRETIKKYADIISKIILTPDGGPADGLNKGFAAATGEIFGFLNADDYFLPGSVTALANYFRKHPDLDVVSGHGYFVDEEGNMLRGIYSHRLKKCPFAYHTNVLVQQSTFFTRDIFEKVGGFNQENRVNWDGELWADMFLNSARFGRIHAYLSAFRIYKTSITGSQNLRPLLEKELARIRLKLGVKHYSLILRRIYWIVDRSSDPMLLWMQIKNGLQHGFTSPIPK